MSLTTILTLIHETEDSAHYAEGPGKDSYPLLGTVTLQRSALPTPTPSEIRVTLEPLAPAQQPRQRPSADLARRLLDAEGVIQQGSTVTIVKNRIAGIHQPPEWLEEYLGRKGTVLWIAAGGAMVKLDHEATWFPFAELIVEE
jgi:hypothetical protein